MRVQGESARVICEINHRSAASSGATNQATLKAPASGTESSAQQAIPSLDKKLSGKCDPAREFRWFRSESHINCK